MPVRIGHRDCRGRRHASACTATPLAVRCAASASRSGVEKASEPEALVLARRQIRLDVDPLPAADLELQPRRPRRRRSPRAKAEHLAVEPTGRRGVAGAEDDVIDPGDPWSVRRHLCRRTDGQHRQHGRRDDGDRTREARHLASISARAAAMDSRTPSQAGADHDTRRSNGSTVPAALESPASSAVPSVAGATPATSAAASMRDTTAASPCSAGTSKSVPA